MTITAEQRAMRAQGLGSSDAPVVVGVSPWKTPLALWMEKIDGVIDIGTTLPMRFGNALEAVIADEWARQHGREVQVMQDTIFDSQVPFLFAHVDRLVADAPNDEGVECKYVSSFSDDWGIPGTDQVPPHVFIQCLHCMMLTHAQRWHVAAINAFYEFRAYVIERNDPLISRLREVEIDFWNMVQQRITPPMTMPSDARLMFKTDDGSSIVATPFIEDKLRTLRHVRSELKSYGDLEDTLVAEIQAYMGEAATLRSSVDSSVLATWKTSRPPLRFDSRAFGEQHPELYQQFCVTGTAARRFILK